MHEAALCGKVEVVRTLLDRGVDLGIRDCRQNTVLDLLGQFPPHVTKDITAVIKSKISIFLTLFLILLILWCSNCGRITGYGPIKRFSFRFRLDFCDN